MAFGTSRNPMGFSRPRNRNRSRILIEKKAEAVRVAGIETSRVGRQKTRSITETAKRRKKSEKQSRRRRERRGRRSLLTPSGSAIGEASTLG